MTTHEGAACRDLRDYTAKEDNLFYKLRMMWDWDDEEFRLMVGIATRCLTEIELDDVVPRYVATFFGCWLHILEGMMRNPAFLRHNRARRTEQETEEYFARRREIIGKLVFWMAMGVRQHPPEHFVLPEWKTPSTTEATGEAPDIAAPTLARQAISTRVPERPACGALYEYTCGDDRRFEPPLVSLEWDDDSFRTLVQLTTKCLKEVEHDDMIPRCIGKLIGAWLQDLKQTLRDPQFLALNRGNRTEQQNRVYFDERSFIIDHLVSWMSAGECQHLPVHFVAPEWRTSAEREEADRIKGTKWWIRDKGKRS